MIKQLKPAVALLAGLLFFAGCGRTATDAEENSDEIIEPNLLYGIPADNYRLEQQIIDRGETLGQILNRYGVSAAQIGRQIICEGIASTASWLVSCSALILISADKETRYSR